MIDALDVVRAFYQAVNRSDTAAVVACYRGDCIVEQIFTADRAVHRGRDAVSAGWAVEFETFAGALPGGMLELGETLEAGTAREIREETGLVVDVGPVIEVFDRILVDDEGRVRYHFVLVDHLCRPRTGGLAAGSDVEGVAVTSPDALAGYGVAEKVRAVVARAMTLERDLTW